MKNPWIIAQSEYCSDEQSYYETIFALANGYVGLRNSLDFSSEGSNPGVFFANVYDNALVTRNEIVNAPNWLDFTYTVTGNPLLLDYLEVLEFKRELYLEHGMVKSHYRLRDSLGRITRVERCEFLPAQDYHTAIVSGSITPENYSADIYLSSAFNYEHGNSMYGGFLKEVRTHHLREVVHEVSDYVYLEVRTIGTECEIGMAAKLVVDGVNERYPFHSKRRVGETVRIVAEEGKTYSFIKYVSFYNTYDRITNLRNASVKKLNEVLVRGYEQIVADHIKVWLRRWYRHDVIIEGDKRAQEAIRFALFHLLQAPHPDKDGTNIASRGLTSEYHLGHFFFNTEVYKSRFFMYQDPDVSRSLLRYRYNSLPAARELAKSIGCEGVRFSEESDQNGQAAGPSKFRNIFTNEVFEEWTGRETHYIGALCALSLNRYFEITQDERFMLECGLELLLETSLFATSLVQYDAVLDKYVVRKVTGPDEYHMHIDNSYFTNYMLKFNIEYTLLMVNRYLDTHGEKVQELLDKVGVTTTELESWLQIKEKIYLPPSRNGVFEQFDGYFDLQDAWITDYDGNNRPIIPAEYEQVAKLLLNSDNQILKQSDVIMLISLFRGSFTREEKLRNMGYYDKRTVHESSLSATHAALVSIDVDDLELAYHYFLICLRFNLDFIPRTDYRNGIHLASYAGGWLVLTEGFAGLRIDGDHLALDPKLPDQWTKVSFMLLFRGNLVRITLTHDWLEVENLDENPPQGTLVIGDLTFEMPYSTKIYVPIRSKTGLRPRHNR